MLSTKSAFRLIGAMRVRRCKKLALGGNDVDVHLQPDSVQRYE